MAFVRRKRFGSREYYYLVEGRWINGQSHQQFLSYLGAVGDADVEKRVVALKAQLGRGHRRRA